MIKQTPITEHYRLYLLMFKSIPVRNVPTVCRWGKKTKEKTVHLVAHGGKHGAATLSLKGELGSKALHSCPHLPGIDSTKLNSVICKAIEK